MTTIHSDISVVWHKLIQFLGLTAFLNWCFTFFSWPTLVLLFLLGVLFSPVGAIIVAYFIWRLVSDRSFPKWNLQQLLRDCRKWRVWNSFRDYFPISLVKTVDLDPGKNYLFISHPLSIINWGVECNFMTEATNFSGKFPGVVPYLLTISFNFYWPFLRKYILALGFCDAAKTSVHTLLSSQRGVAAIMVVPAAEKKHRPKTSGQPFLDGDMSDSSEDESSDTELCATGGKYYQDELRTIKFLKSTGFVKMALRTGTSLVPCYTFGQSHSFSKVIVFCQRSWLLKKVMSLLKLLSLYPYVMALVYLACIPKRQPIATVVGHPIQVPKVTEPDEEMVDRVTRAYLTEITELFESQKKEYGVHPEVHLRFG